MYLPSRFISLLLLLLTFCRTKTTLRSLYLPQQNFWQFTFEVNMSIPTGKNEMTWRPQDPTDSIYILYVECFPLSLNQQT
jgi:hypothetical protein